MNDKLGDYLKGIEARHTTYLEHGQGIYARLDGKGFSKLTKGMKRPFDETFTDIMVSVATTLFETTRADVAYVQSDEISLYWKPMDVMDFSGRKEKWVGELSGLATAAIMKEIFHHFPDRVDKLPRFDCRVFNVNDEDAQKFFFWRFLDCRKNSVSMVAYSRFSHKSLKYATTEDRIQRLRDIGHPWEDYTEQQKYGTWIYKEKTLVDVDKSKIPDHVHHKVPDKAERNVVKYRHINHMGNYQTIESLYQ